MNVGFCCQFFTFLSFGVVEIHLLTLQNNMTGISISFNLLWIRWNHTFMMESNFYIIHFIVFFRCKQSLRRLVWLSVLCSVIKKIGQTSAICWYISHTVVLILSLSGRGQSQRRWVDIKVASASLGKWDIQYDGLNGKVWCRCKEIIF